MMLRNRKFQYHCAPLLKMMTFSNKVQRKMNLLIKYKNMPICTKRLKQNLENTAGIYSKIYNSLGVAAVLSET